jgi:cytochrome P450
MSLYYPPGPKSISPLGVTTQFRHDPLGFTMTLVRDYGDFVTLPGPFYQPGFLLNAPDLLPEVLVKQADKFQKPAIFKKIFKSSFGNGLFLSEGDFWKRQRRLAQPAFHHKRIQTYTVAMVGHTRLLLATIAQKYRLQLSPGRQVEPNPLATLGCKGSVPMHVTAR